MVKSKHLRCYLSLLTAFAVLVTSVCATLTVGAFSSVSEAPFTAYYSSDMKAAAEGSATFSEVATSNDWELSSDGTRLVRKKATVNNWNQDVEKDMSVLYYNVKEYKNFDMTVTYTTIADYDDWSAFFGFGGEIGKSWLANSADTGFIIHSGGLVLNIKNKAWLHSEAACGHVTGWSDGAVHTLRLKVFQGGYTVWIDGYELTSGANADYTGGYIWFAANSKDVSFGIPEVTELVDTTVFSAYYSANLATNETVSPASIGTQWSLDSTNTKLQRNLSFNGDESYNDWGSGTTEKMSILYYNVKSYKSFDMMVDYRAFDDVEQYIAFAGFGAQIGKSWKYNNGDYAFVLRPDGAIVDAKNTSTVITPTGRTAAEQTAAAGKTWAYGVHKLRIHVSDGEYTVWIDDYEVANEELNDSYQGGYIYFAANAGTVQFGVPTITEYIDETAYESYYSADMSTADPQKSDLSNYWTLNSDKTLLERNTSENSTENTKNNAVLYWDGKDYTNFVSNIDYSLSTGSKLLFGFGAEIGKSYVSNVGDNALAIDADGTVVNVKTGAQIGTSSAKAMATNAGKTWKADGLHKLTVTSQDSEFFISVDGYEVGSFKNDSYQGGYIWYGASTSGAKIGMPGITSNDKELTPFDKTAFDSYFTANARTTDPSAVDFSTYWNISRNGSMAVRNSTSNTLGNNTDKNMAILYLNTKTYKNFDMTVNFKTLADRDVWAAYFGFGAEKGKSWNSNSGESAFVYHAGGLVLNAKVNDGWLHNNAVSGSVANDGGKWIDNGIHTLRVMVYEQEYTIWIDGYKIVTGKNSNYNGGYIWFASNGADVQFGMPEISDVIDNSVYDSYYCENLTTTTDMTPSVTNDWWSVSDDGQRLVRRFDYKGDQKYNDWESTNNKYITSLWYNAQSYEDFIMTVDYVSALDNQIAYVGFGGELGKSWKNSTKDTTFVISADGSLMNAEDKSDWLATGDQTAAAQTAAAGKTWNKGGVHTLKIRMSGKTYTVWIDGYKIGERTADNYEGGYIYFAACAGTVQFGTPEVIVPIKETVFSSYYSEDITENDAVAEDFSTRWAIAEDGKRVERKSGNDALDINVKNNMAILYYNARKYNNFDMTVEFSTLDNMNDWAAFFGFGAQEMGKSWQNDDNQTVFTIHSAGLLLNTKVKDGWYDATAASGAASQDGKVWKRDGIHTLRLKVEDCYYEVWIDGYPVGEGGNWDYKGGYIYFAANQGNVTWGVPTVTSLDVEDEAKDPNFKDYTWEPTEDDYKFDFSLKTAPIADIFKYIALDAENKK